MWRSQAAQKENSTIAWAHHAEFRRKIFFTAFVLPSLQETEISLHMMVQFMELKNLLWRMRKLMYFEALSAQASWIIRKEPWSWFTSSKFTAIIISLGSPATPEIFQLLLLLLFVRLGVLSILRSSTAVRFYSTNSLASKINFFTMIIVREAQKPRQTFMTF